MIVFTNGCFDILHPGHIELLQKARALGSKLIVGLNSDDSVRRIKGPGRPLFNESERSAVLMALECVDEVRIFDDSTPQRLITELEPDVLVKGGDWKENEIIGADLVKSRGGKVVSIPLVQGYSTTAIIDRLNVKRPTEQHVNSTTVQRSLNEHAVVFNDLNTTGLRSIYECAEIIKATLKNGGKILICGNGGSAADAQHIAAELVGRYETERTALPAIALTTDTSALTALANDYSFERVFSRQVEGLARAGDCLIAISTSGDSNNVINAVMSARSRGCKVVGMTGVEWKKTCLAKRCLSDGSFKPNSTNPRSTYYRCTYLV